MTNEAEREAFGAEQSMSMFVNRQDYERAKINGAIWRGLIGHGLDIGQRQKIANAIGAEMDRAALGEKTPTQEQNNG